MLNPEHREKPLKPLEGFDLSKAGCLCDGGSEGSSFVGTTNQWMGEALARGHCQSAQREFCSLQVRFVFFAVFRLFRVPTFFGLAGLDSPAYGGGGFFHERDLP